ncbi:MAG: cystathionine beta-lyase [Alphaproteobacteria bacterium]|nr:cystathionine beta-lyase [Alphaproteobacteria bacterium]
MAKRPTSPPGDQAKGLATRLTHAGRDRELTGGAVNPQVQRASTVLVESADQLYAPGVWTYGRHGTATHKALAQAFCEIEDAAHCALVPSGLLACTVPIFTFAEAGGHVLVTDNCYGPTRRFCDRSLKRWGVEVEYFDPAIGAGITSLLRPNTKLVFMESPGSLTFEVCDAPAISSAARKVGAVSIMDNTWSAGVYHRPLDLGVDISVQAATKYVSGAADVLNGGILTRSEALIRRIEASVDDLGLNVSPDDAYLVLRGLRTLATRMSQHQASGLDIATWLQSRSEVRRVLHPALPNDPGHALWKRDFSGSTGLFGVVLEPASRSAVNAFLDALELFGLGFSWGGFESLAIHCDPQIRRTATQPAFEGPLLRLSIGLESPDDLKADLERGFDALRAAR